MEYLSGKLLRAFKKSVDLTLEERTNKIINQQKAISKELNQQSWVIFNKKRVEINIQDQNIFEIIYPLVKKGMNTGLITRTRYNQEDIPDTQSRVTFYSTKRVNSSALSITHSLGYYGRFNESESVSIENFETDCIFENRDVFIGLIKCILDFYNPDVLYLTGEEEFRKKTKRNIENFETNNAPWTGWFVYLSNKILPNCNAIDFCNITKMVNGHLIETTDCEIFDQNNEIHCKNALKLEDWFIENNIRTK